MENERMAKNRMEFYSELKTKKLLLMLNKLDGYIMEYKEKITFSVYLKKLINITIKKRDK